MLKIKFETYSRCCDYNESYTGKVFCNYYYCKNDDTSSHDCNKNKCPLIENGVIKDEYSKDNT